MTIGRAIAGGLTAAIFLGSPARAVVHALVMGFDTYNFKISLEGSRNDAADLSAVLRHKGVTDITVLNDSAVRRADVMKAWTGMVSRAAAGDVLFVSFSGHGNRSPEKGSPKHTPDGFEKGFLLPSYDEDKNPEEQLRDENIYDLFKAASDKGLSIVFVADACHAGAAVRAVTTTPSKPKFQMFQTHGAPLPPPPDPATVAHRPPIPTLTIFSAADEKQTIQEFTIDGQRRGALSYVLARGLDGAAADGDGRLTLGDLGRYMVTNVRLRSNNTQVPSATTPQPDLSLFAAATKPPVAQAGLPPLKTLAVFSDSAMPALAGASPAARQEDAGLAWMEASRILNPHGDVLAQRVAANQLQGAVDARRVVLALTDTIGAGGDKGVDTDVAAIGNPASDRYYTAGEHIKIEADASQLHALTVVDLTADGTVQFLWPRTGDPVEWTRAAKPNFEVKVTPPFGADTLIFIESDRPLTDLHSDLARLDGQVAPTDFYDALRLWLPKVKAKLGLQPVFTCARSNPDGTCG